MNVSFLVADEDLACEELLIGRPYFKHLRVHANTLLDEKRSALNGSDCSDVGNLIFVAANGHESRLMIDWLHDSLRTLEQDALAVDRPRVNYHTARQNSDPFPDPAFLYLVDEGQHEDIRSASNAIVTAAVQNKLGVEHAKELQNIVDALIDIFRTSLSSRQPAQVQSLKITARPDATPVRVRLRK